MNRLFFSLPCVVFSICLSAKLPESPNLEESGSSFIYGGLCFGDSKDVVLSKLRKNGFIQIYEERDVGVVRCAIRWDGFRFELVSKFKDGKLNLCLIEGNKGWQDFHYHDVVAKEWEALKLRLGEIYGRPTSQQKFPDLFNVPVNDLGGVVTNVWKVEDRLLMLSVRRYETKDCCTDQLLEFSCCTLLIQPITNKKK